MNKKSKAIIGIAIAAIMIASVMAAMVTPAAAWTRTARSVTDGGSAVGNDGVWGTPDDVGIEPIAIGELITLASGTVAGTTTLTKLLGSPALPTGETLSTTASGIDTTGASPGQYISNNAPVTSVRLIDPKLDLSLRLSTSPTEEVSSVVVGQTINVVVDTNIPQAVGVIPPIQPGAGGPNDLKLVLVNKKTGVQTTAGVTAGVLPIMWQVQTGQTAAVSGLGAGEYTFVVETDGTGNAQAAIDERSDPEDMRVRAAAIDVSAEPTEQVAGAGNDVIVTVTAGAEDRVVVQLTAGQAYFVPTEGDWRDQSLAGSTDTGIPPAPDGTNRPTFVGTIPADGTLVLVVNSDRTGGNTIRAAIDANADGTINAGETTSTTSTSFRKAITTVDVSARKITIGDKLIISGTTTSGVDEVAIFVDNVLQRRVAIEADGTYEWEWDTSLGLIEGPTYVGRPLKPGALTIKVFQIHIPADLEPNGNPQGLVPPVPAAPQPGDGLDRDCGGDGPLAANLPECRFFDPANTANTRPADASTGISAVAGDLTATMEIPRVAKEDDVVVMGIAAGETTVRLFLIDSDGDVVVDDFESVMEDNTFETSLATLTSWRSGTYKMLLVTDGRDDVTILTGNRVGGIEGAQCASTVAVPVPNGIGSTDPNTGVCTGRLDAGGATLNGEVVSGMTQVQIIEKIENCILPSAGAAGSDDKMVILSFKLEDPSVEITEVEGAIIAIEQISVDVSVTDEALSIKGITNRIDGTPILVTAESAIDPKYDLPPQTVPVVEGTFEVELDASGAEAGKYTVTADDLSRATDELDVIVTLGVTPPKVAPSNVTPTATPITTPPPPTTPTPTPTPTPTESPKPPGFEAIFAIAGLLAVAYLVHRRKK